MLNVPVDKIVEKISSEKGLSVEEINRRIETKYNQLAGLVSKDGAAHIVANELGVKILEAELKRPLKINEVTVGARNLEIAGRVTQVFELKTFTRGDGSSGQLASFILADQTGKVRVVGWGKHADAIKSLEPGAPIKLSSCYTRENLRGQPEVHLNDRSVVTLNPNMDIPEVQIFGKQDPGRKEIKDLGADDQNVELMGTMIQLFNPTFYEVCPTCNKRTRADEQGLFKCPTHGQITPAFSCVFNVYLDDGTGNVRCVFFRNQFERLVDRTMDQLIHLKDDPSQAEELKNALLGNTIKVVGRAQHNTMFDRTEFIVQQVFPQPDLQEEIQRLKTVLGK